MNMSSSFSPRGNTPEQQTSESASTPEQKPSESFSEKSATPRPKPKPEHPKTEADKVDAVKSMFRGEQDNSPTDGGETSADTSYLDSFGEAPDTTPEAPKHLDPNTLAEQLGIKPDQLYKQMQISLGDDGETLTLGELKDRVQGQRQAALEMTQKEQAFNEREARLLQNQQLLAAISSEIQGKLSPQTVREVKQRQANHEAHQNRLMYETMPELKDKQNFERFRKGVAETLQPYGFKTNELNIQDHRMLLVVRDLMRTKAQLKRLMEFEPPKEDAVPPNQRKPQGKRKRISSAERLKQQARGGTESDKLSAVSALIRGR